ncbi:hypothetical protein [Protofrankia symbiont of Coriaria ruscifolia]|uniref:Uncharacterized protein n=1 Tax=Candidatus Protofrankia californiensis TaxID=1839754 RepID=A0A1C3P140_9ACTN|nr:hypothetical protein [Protofrankia symbiont of Coriaria ruscifolia]SBW23532.1 hypothetical protein FDG2_3811 [Candidatus Protofrankia californiensis]
MIAFPVACWPPGQAALGAGQMVDESPLTGSGRFLDHFLSITSCRSLLWFVRRLDLAMRNWECE